MSPTPKSPRNRLLRALSPDDFGLVGPQLEPIEVPLRTVFEKPNKPIEHVYFIESGMASVVANGMADRRIEVGVIGRDGMSGMTVILGNHRSPHETFVQMAGEALRMTSDDLRQSMKASATLQPFLLRYAQAFMIQTAHTALANGRATIHERLARWLLMAHDRIDGDQLTLVHEFLALMLGVRREGVTIALQELEREGLIRTTRGNITIVDRKGLEKTADGSYGVPEAEFDRLIGGQSPRADQAQGPELRA
jgi:CRP-like cAMP-binding protein